MTKQEAKPLLMENINDPSDCEDTTRACASVDYLSAQSDSLRKHRRRMEKFKAKYKERFGVDLNRLDINDARKAAQQLADNAGTDVEEPEDASETGSEEEPEATPEEKMDYREFCCWLQDAAWGVVEIETNLPSKFGWIQAMQISWGDTHLDLLPADGIRAIHFILTLILRSFESEVGVEPISVNKNMLGVQVDRGKWEHHLGRGSIFDTQPEQ